MRPGGVRRGEWEAEQRSLRSQEAVGGDVKKEAPQRLSWNREWGAQISATLRAEQSRRGPADSLAGVGSGWVP